ncbi:Branched-chain-amino-acid aminotransferase [Pirellulimonas nuda]|uniref:Branched-chain-amino-acid aminotransferase n=1 Tax=Pirellulimonas nuda TaxID=2528009 RepID=A0A518DFG8_9BACT|nr:branched-chain-amino-acid transaminase [Pirellulimonas nuda]QDU90210.1 Branched-chain-amino-acid aminotransferase [Pirellulimonas nuda]
MAKQVYLNGELVPQAEAKVSVFDHGLLYGDGVFEGLRAYRGKVFRLTQHIDRLYDSAKGIWLEIPLTREAMADAVDATVAANGLSDCYIRLIVTRGAGSLGLDPRKCSNPQVIIIADSIALYPAEFYEKGLEIITSSVIRNHPAALSPRIKSLNYLNNILAKIEGIQAGCIEALMLNHKGEVAECTGDNLFLVKKGGLSTPSLEAGILDGITRDFVLEIAAEQGVPAVERPLTKHDVYIADECFLTGTAAEIIPVVKVDSRVIGDGKPGPITRRLEKRFREETGK